MTTSFVKAVFTSSALVFLGALALACGAPEPTGQSSEAISIGGRLCPTWGCNSSPLSASCQQFADTSCWHSPSSWDWSPVWTGGHPNPTLQAEMVSAGCTNLQYYNPGFQGFNGTWTMATCPAGVSADVDALAFSGCDPCTGTPLKGWEFVEWVSSNANPAGCHSPLECNSENGGGDGSSSGGTPPPGNIQ